MSFLFTSESVTGGHPDKLADQVSDAVLDAYLAQDPRARVAIETFVTNGLCLVGGEVRARPDVRVDVADVARRTLRDAGYDDPACGFPADDVAVLTAVGAQSPDIAQGVDRGDAELQGAGDQGLMFGFACRDTPELMPLPIHLAHRLARGLSRLRTDGVLPYLLPDGKTQVTVEYGDDGRPRRLESVVVSTQHRADVRDPQRIRADLERHLFPSALAPWGVDARTKVHVNPTGAFLIGGPKGDTGLTGRKIIVDTYGGWAPHGGGAFSGKDPSKVDRSAAYMARHVAKNLVASGLVDSCEVQLAYVIGVAEPASLRVRGEGWGREVPADEVLVRAVRQVFRLTPAAIIRELDLLRPIYRATAVGGHFGREEPGFTWERTDKAEALAEAVRGSAWAARR
jgi:S-adenosylmethionine synthetase